MDEQERIFDEYCRNARQCGALDLSREDNQTYAAMHRWSRVIIHGVADHHVQPEGSRGLHVGVVDSPSLNAFAWRFSGVYLIGVNKGTYTTFYAVALRLMSDPRFLPNMGEPERERRDLPTVNLLDVRQLFGPNGLVEPRCPKRAVYARMLFEECLEFLVPHELAHIVRGHVDLVAGMAGDQNSISELALPASSNNVRGHGQAMETHADHSAIKMCLSNMIRKHTCSRDPGVALWDDTFISETRREFYGDLTLSLLRMTLATYLVFRLFVTRRFHKNRLTRGTHPHPFVRQMLLMGVLYETLLEEAPELAEDSIGNAAIRLVEGAIGFLGGKGDGRIVPVPSQLTNNWKYIRPYLMVLLGQIDQLRIETQPYTWAGK